MVKLKQVDHLYRLLVDFVEFDPETALPGDWLNYQVRLVMLRVGANVQMARHLMVATPQRPSDPEKEVRAVHADLRQLVRQYAAGGPPTLIPVSAKIAAFGGETTAGRFLAEGNVRDITILAVVALLAQADSPPIALCPEDDKLFFRVRRQQYCSRSCVNRANARAYRQRMLEKKPRIKTRRPK